MMVKAKIYQPTKTAMQSGRGKTGGWVVEYPRSSKVGPDTLMGWQSSSDTMRQIKLRFPTQQAAMAYCEEHKIEFSLTSTHKRKLRIPQIFFDDQHIGGYDETRALEKENKLQELLK